MEPVTLGLAAASLVAKAALEAAAGETSWNALKSVGNRLRNWFAHRDDDEAVKALDGVEAYPDSPKAIEALAGRITEAARSDPDEADGLSRLVDNIEAAAGAPIVTFITQVRDQAKVGRIIQVTGDYHEH